MTVYVVVIVVVLALDLLNQHIDADIALRRVLLVLALLLLGLVSGLRSTSVGFDTESYTHRYLAVAFFGPDDSSLYMEVGFRYFCYLLDAIGFGARGVYVIAALLLVVALYCFITQYVSPKYWLFAVFLFVCGGYYFASLNILRQYMALAIMMFAFILWSKRHFLPSAVLILIAFSFHSASLVVLLVIPLWWALKGKYRDAIIVCILIASAVISFWGVSDIASMVLIHIPRWDQYANSHWVTDRNFAAGLKLIMPNLILLWFLVNSRKRRVQHEIGTGSDALSERDTWSLSGAVLYVAIFNCVFGFVTLTRMSEYFAFFYIAFVPKFLENRTGNVKTLCYLGIVVYYVLLTVGAVFIQDTNSVLPYEALGW